MVIAVAARVVRAFCWRLSGRSVMTSAAWLPSGQHASQPADEASLTGGERLVEGCLGGLALGNGFCQPVEPGIAAREGGGEFIFRPPQCRIGGVSSCDRGLNVFDK
jgi:hypothetical protein